MTWVHRTAALAVAAPLVAAAACSGNPPPVPLHADEVAMEHLRGRWQGAYESRDTGRHGTIRFELTATGDTARGDVVMLPSAGEPGFRPLETEDEPRPSSVRTYVPRLLGIHFVRCRGGHVQGTVEAYRDPETGHPLVTTFHGEVAGDSIGGTFSTYDRVGERRTGGEWYVLRRR